MIYRDYGKTGKKISALGFGSIRFPAELLGSEEGLWQCAELVRKASSLGVNFFDVAPTYANNQAEHIYGMAFQDMPNPFYVSDKSIITTDKTADDVRHRIERSLRVLGVDKISFYHMWSIMNFDHYQRVMAKGGPYEGALIAKQEGLIEHICFSTHANVTENIRIIQDDVFEGMIISFNALNYRTILPVLQEAESKNIGVTIMNPLGGGMVIKQPQFFEYLMQPDDDGIATAALRFVASAPGVTSAISGMASHSEIEQNAAALSLEPVRDRFNLVMNASRDVEQSLCTGCGYCRGCPKDIPIMDYMQAYNMRLFPNMEYMGRKLPLENEGQIKANNIFRTLRQNSGIIPEDSKNICIQCGKCEDKCTQHLPIISYLEDIANLSAEYEYSKYNISKRITDIIKQSKSRTIGIYPSGVYSEALYSFIMANMAEELKDYKLYIFDKNPDLWGNSFYNLKIMPPKKIPELVDTILISHFLYQDEIYKEISYFENEGIYVAKLHKALDIPYFG